MRIISPYKDYYDYLQGVYGIDDRVVLKRNTIKKLRVGSKDETMKEAPYKIETLQEAQIFDFHIMGKRLKLIWHKNRFWSKEELRAEGFERIYSRTPGNKIFTYHVVPTTDKRVNRWNVDIDPLVTDLNDKVNCPIVLVINESKSSWIEFPSLQQFNMAKYISPEDMYTSLYNWLSRINENTTEQTDKEKILSHGFDVKTSFRKM